ncbi:hypothetical protein K432DRAFT_419831 [Lepidopterella palustris CBS 459.81]|uniref:Uncharacterized protein n=1 Tax=Lepidopterella palustris CBS 459.81 TaxID=1314670 RepID=A0A8E2E160_9PEZI|nr:hypothetical protein K432DRAFT_419831 [Lepidopterella palustris CBS 459.81]
MPGDKKGSDLSSRLKRPVKISSRSSKTTSTSSPISAPPKAAIAAGKAKKDDIYRRKNSLDEMLLQTSTKAGSQLSSSSPPASDDDEQRPLTDTSDLSITDRTSQIDRIAELEKALAKAHSQQNTMAEEMERFRQHELVYRDAIEGYKQQLLETHNQRYGSSATNVLKEFEQETDRHRSWAKERTRLQEEVYELQGKVAELQADLLERDAMWKSQWELDVTNRIHERDQLNEQLHATEKEAQERRKQLLDLKQSISALTRMENQVTDSELAERMDQLFHRIREWVISNFRRSQLDFSNLTKESIASLNAINPNYKQTLPTEKISLYQAIVASNMMNIFDEACCVGIPENGALASVRHLADYFQGGKTQQFQEWRRVTIRMLGTGTGNELIKKNTQLLLQEMATRIEGILSAISGVKTNQSMRISIINILQTAVDLQNVLLSQRAQYKVTFIHNETDTIQQPFDILRMDPVNEEDDDDANDKGFRFCVFPVLEKFGNETGENLDVRNIVLKGRVFCGKKY